MKLGVHPHYLGSWDALAAVELRDADGTWRALREDEREAYTTRDDADAAVLTLPRWLGSELAAIEWAGEAPDDAARTTERAQFTQYGERVVAFFRFAGVALPDTCEARLCATTDHAGQARTRSEGCVIVANVGDERLRVALAQGAALVLPPGQACVVAAASTPYAVSLASPEAEFGLHLELDG